MQYVLYEAAKEGTTLGNNGVAGVATPQLSYEPATLQEAADWSTE